MKAIAIFVLMLALVACSATPTYFDGQSATYEHDKAKFEGVMKNAEKRCAGVGKLVKHERTDCSDKCISTFTCVAKEDPLLGDLKTKPL